MSTWTLPPLSLLDPLQPETERPGLDGEARRIEATLAEHGAAAAVAGVSHGPQATQYRLTPAPGVLPAKIARVLDAVSLAVGRTVRYGGIVGSHVALEVPLPDDERRTVQLQSVFRSGGAFVNLGFPVGLQMDGSVLTARLSDLPHLLIAGATGGGKSGFLNAVLVSLLMRNTPGDLELTLIDPKRVELEPYAALPHLDRPIVTEAAEAVEVLADACRDMDARYDIFSDVGAKNLREYNDRALQRLPRRVIVIDELGDLIAVGPAVQQHIIRLGQKARAAGIHLIVATQRPDAKTITPQIKAQLPARAVFRVSSHTDSGIALGQSGAERLTGRGDGLWLSPTSPDLRRFQSPWVTEDEVTRVVAHWVREAAPFLEAEAAAQADAQARVEALYAQNSRRAQDEAQAAQAAAEADREYLDSLDVLKPGGPPLSPAEQDELLHDPDAFVSQREETIAERIADRAFELFAEKLKGLEL